MSRTALIKTESNPGVMRVEQARALIASCKTVDEVKQIRDQAEAIKAYMRQQSASRELQNDAAEIKLRAERRIGELLIEQKERGERATAASNLKQGPKLHDATSGAPTLADLGIEKTAAKRWQDVARIPQDDFDAYVEEAKADGEVTSAGALRIARSLTKPVKEPEPFHVLIALGDLKDTIRKMVAKWPSDRRHVIPEALRDLAVEFEKSNEG